MNIMESELLVKLFYELGALRKVMRAHQQRLLTTDPTDTIASHSFRTTAIGILLANQFDEEVDILKIMIMCLFHDLPEVRTNDHHWVQKRYVKTYDLEVLEDQLSKIPGKLSLIDIMKEYEERIIIESVIAKDADLLDQLLLLKEYEQQGNRQASIWLIEDNGLSKTERLIITPQAKKIAEEIRRQNPGDWTTGLVTHKCR